jgi:hypothetical protein
MKDRHKVNFRGIAGLSVASTRNREARLGFGCVGGFARVNGSVPVRVPRARDQRSSIREVGVHPVR